MKLGCRHKSHFFNQEKALVGAFSVIVKTGCETDGSFYSTSSDNGGILASASGGALAKCKTEMNSFGWNKKSIFCWKVTHSYISCIASSMLISASRNHRAVGRSECEMAQGPGFLC